MLGVTPNALLDLKVSYIGYQSEHILISPNQDTLINIKLWAGVELTEYEVAAVDNNYSHIFHIGQLNLTSKNMKWMPSVSGEGNIMMALKTLPGVSAGKEGSSELYVRGGSHDQNLIPLDKAPVYNLNHAFGLLSVFNKLYHRLDVGFHMQKTKPKGYRTWSLGVINLYNQQNTYSIYRNEHGEYKKLVLFPFMPFISFNRRF